MAFVGGLVGIVATTIGVVVAWPADWWPRHPPEPEVYVKGVTEWGGYVVPHPAGVFDKPPHHARFPCRRGMSDWVKSLGGVPNRISVDFVLTTERSESVVVLGLKPHVRKLPTPPMRTTVVDCVAGSGYWGRSADLVVDSQPPKFRLNDENGQPIERIGINLGKGEAAEFHLSAEAETPGAVYEWTADLELLVGGEPMKVTVSDGGKPFKVAGALPDSAPRVDLTLKLADDGSIYCTEHPQDPAC